MWLLFCNYYHENVRVCDFDHFLEYAVHRFYFIICPGAIQIEPRPERSAKTRISSCPSVFDIVHEILYFMSFLSGCMKKTVADLGLLLKNMQWWFWRWPS